MGRSAIKEVANKKHSMAPNTRIPVSRSTRELVKDQKRGGETYDNLLRNMVEQYDPDEAKN